MPEDIAGTAPETAPEIAPAEFEEVRQGKLPLPNGWMLSEHPL